MSRFRFGENWSHFLAQLSEDRIQDAKKSLQQLFGLASLEGKTFLDVGSGSGLFSLAARKLGARVTSFDYDPQAAECTQELRKRYFPSDSTWRIEQGSALDSAYLKSLGSFDLVYSWGVLHHTGSLWEALKNVADVVAPGGQLGIAIYNDQGVFSRFWWLYKRIYVSSPALFQRLMVSLFGFYFGFRSRIATLVKGTSPKRDRGMSEKIDLVDWVGGFPFEVATPEAIKKFYETRQFRLKTMKTVGRGHGCNEFVFERIGSSSPKP
jgi:SAM-dependent methyltransferase